jgi:ribosomal protein S18 acetylase RimI-like enzyme
MIFNSNINYNSLKIFGHCRNAHESDILDVAKIHLAAFDGFFLSQLGYKFLCVMYRAFLKSPSCLFLVFETASGQTAGFAVGALQGQKNRWLAVRFLPQFLLAVVPAFLRSPVPVLKRLWARFYDTCDPLQVPSDGAVLRSIGVLPSLRGSGAAASLLQSFEVLALSKGAVQVFLTTDEMNNERAQRFYFRGDYRLVARFQQDGDRSMWLMAKNLK